MYWVVLLVFLVLVVFYIKFVNSRLHRLLADKSIGYGVTLVLAGVGSIFFALVGGAIGISLKRCIEQIT